MSTGDLQIPYLTGPPRADYDAPEKSSWPPISVSTSSYIHSLLSFLSLLSLSLSPSSDVPPVTFLSILGLIITTFRPRVHTGKQLGRHTVEIMTSLHKTARTISVIAGTLVALSCGTNVRDISELIPLRIITVNSIDSMHTPHGRRNSPNG